MQKRLSVIITVLLIALTTFACQASFVSESPLAMPVRDVSILPTPTPFLFPEDLSRIEVEYGRAVVIGRLISTESSLPVRDTPVRLAEIYYAEEGNRDPNQGAWALDNAFSPFAYSDENGLFIFENVEARDYVIFVGDIMSRWTIEVNEDGLPNPRTMPVDQVTNLGLIFVDY
jgi:hypothetical protein